MFCIYSAGKHLNHNLKRTHQQCVASLTDGVIFLMCYRLGRPNAIFSNTIQYRYFSLGNKLVISIWYQHATDDPHVHTCFGSIERLPSSILFKGRVTVSNVSIATCCVGVQTTVASLHRGRNADGECTALHQYWLGTVRLTGIIISWCGEWAGLTLSTPFCSFQPPPLIWSCQCLI